MNNNLPRVYANTKEEIKPNSQDIYYDDFKERVSSNDNLSIYSKINRIFNSRDYIYKSDVLITINNKELHKTLIGKTSNSLLTMDNEIIKIDDIQDIKKA